MTTADPSGLGSAPPVSRQRALAVAVAVLLFVQVLVAVLALFGPRPARFGWQMYSGVPVVPVVTAIEDGRETVVDVNDWLVTGRFEIDFVDLARTHACEMTGADTVRVEAAGGSEEIDCR